MALTALSAAGAAACASTASTAATTSSASPGSSRGSGNPTGPSSATGLPACGADQVGVRIKPLPGAATGRTFMDIVLTDESSSACTVTGSVKLAVADAARHPIAVPTSVFPGSGAATVTLRPGGSAAETVAYGSDGDPAPGQTVCGPPVAFFDVTVPGATSAVAVPVAGRDVCPHDSITLSDLIPGDYSPPF